MWNCKPHKPFPYPHVAFCLSIDHSNRNDFTTLTAHMWNKAQVAIVSMSSCPTDSQVQASRNTGAGGEGGMKCFLKDKRSDKASGVLRHHDTERLRTHHHMPPGMVGSSQEKLYSSQCSQRGPGQAKSQEARAHQSLYLDVLLCLAFTLGLETTGGTYHSSLFLPSDSLQDTDRRHARHG